MKNLLRSTLAVCALCVGMTVAAVEAGDDAPSFSAWDFAGQPVAFPDAASDDTTVVIFWATWCGYCKAFMPWLEQIEADYRERGVQVLTINAREDGTGNPAQYIADLDFPMTSVRSGNAIARAWGVEFIPGVFVVDAQGMIAFRRPWTDLPAGQEVAELWDQQVRDALDAALQQ